MWSLQPFDFLLTERLSFAIIWHANRWCLYLLTGGGSTKYAQIDINATETAQRVGAQHALGREERLQELEQRKRGSMNWDTGTHSDKHTHKHTLFLWHWCWPGWLADPWTPLPRGGRAVEAMWSLLENNQSTCTTNKLKEDNKENGWRCVTHLRYVFKTFIS